MNSLSRDAGVAVVIPCYRVRQHILEVIAGLPDWISGIYIVDDCCPEGSGTFLSETCLDPRLRIIWHTRNQGVGRATCSGYAAAMKDGFSIIVKMDGDNQMDAAYLRRLIQPITEGRADFSKGNRFYDLAALSSMPLVRRIGNLGLTLLTKIASGYWHIADPTNGYTAIHRSALSLLTLESVSRRYFFESSMLIHLNIIRAVAIDVPIPARYGSETSSLSIWRVLFGFPPRLLRGFIQRIFWRYFIYDVNAVSVLLLTGSGLVASGIGFGSYRWYIGVIESNSQSAGTVALALLPIILGFQMLLQAILLDVVEKPTLPICEFLNEDTIKSYASASQKLRSPSNRII